MRIQRFKLAFICVSLVMTLIMPVTALTWHLPKSMTVPRNMKWHLGDYWIQTLNCDMKITRYFVNNWLNYTVSGGTQYIHKGEKPVAVYFDDVNQTEGSTWSYADGTVTVTPPGTNVGILWQAQQQEQQTPFMRHAYASSYLVEANNILFLFNATSSLMFQNTITQNVSLYIATGILNTSQNSLRIYNGGGHFRFLADNNTKIKIDYSVNAVKISGDENKTLRAISPGSTVTVQKGNDVLITWDITIPPLWPLVFVLGMVGLVGMFGGPYYAVSNFKKKKYYEGARNGLIVTVIGIALFIAWLW